jgi:hypothetical protein
MIYHGNRFTLIARQNQRAPMDARGPPASRVLSISQKSRRLTQFSPPFHVSADVLGLHPVGPACFATRF